MFRIPPPIPKLFSAHVYWPPDKLTSFEDQNVRNSLVVLIALVLGVVSLAQTTPPNAPANAGGANSLPPSAQFGSSAIWHPAPDFMTSAHAACDNAPPPAVFGECFINQMVKAGAPQEALKFARELYNRNGQIGIVEAFKDFGPIGLAWVVYPLRANDNDGLLLLNGDPQFLDPDDMQKLDKTAVEHDPLFLQWKKTAPKVDVWAGDRSGGEAQVRFARVWAGAKPGEQRFLFSYPLIDGCRACARSGFANFWWDFDAKGKFQGTHLLSVTRGVPPIKRDLRLPPAGSRPPVDTKPSPSGTTSSPSGGAPPPPTR
jgi:hypothetical protein